MTDRYQKYYVIGDKILYRLNTGYDNKNDTALFDYPIITKEQVRHSMFNQVEVRLYDSFEKIKKHALPSAENRKKHAGQWWEAPLYIRPIFEVYLLDSSKIDIKSGTSFTLTSNIVINHVWLGSNNYRNRHSFYYPKTYTAMFSEKPTQEKSNQYSILDNIKSILFDYSYPVYGLILSMHWNRHHIRLANEIRDHFPNNEEEAYTYLLEHRNKFIHSKGVNTQGSFLRRMDFAIAKLAEHIHESKKMTEQHASLRSIEAYNI